MSSINQVLPMETLLQVLKSLGSLDMVKSRRTCREWNQVLDETQSCWKEIVLPQMNLLNTRSAVALFDSKSGSQLTKVSLIIRSEESEDINVCLLANALLKSIRTLKTISIQLIQNHTSPYNDYPFARLGSVLMSQALNLIEYKHFRRFEWESCRLVFRMPLAAQGARLVHQNSRLKVLCLPLSALLLGFLSTHFNNLASFTIVGTGNRDSEFELSQFLQRHSKTLKHLRLPKLERENFTQIHFPSLEVLELDNQDGLAPTFPLWILAPSYLKVRAQQVPFILYSNKNIDFSLLWISNVTNISRLTHSAPHLHTLRTQLSGAGLHSTEFESLLKALKDRRAPYDINRSLEDINRLNRMTRRETVPLISEREPLKKLIIPFNQLNPEEITQLQEVVDLVIDSALQPDLWEVEV